MPRPSPEERQHAFEQSVAIALHLWPALSVAVANSWGGSDSADKRDWFAGVLVSQFPEIANLEGRHQAGGQQQQQRQEQDETPDAEYVEAMLLQVMVDEFEVTVDDDSALEVAELIVRIWSQCLGGVLDHAQELRRQWEARRGGPQVPIARAEDPDQETDDDSDGSSGGGSDSGDTEDVDMDHELPPRLVEERKGGAPAEMDEDGFTKVVRRKR